MPFYCPVDHPMGALSRIVAIHERRLSDGIFSILNVACWPRAEVYPYIFTVAKKSFATI